MGGRVPVCSFCAATVKPDVVFFGEDLPQKYFLHTEDFPKADLLLIMGTSLQVRSRVRRARREPFTRDEAPFLSPPPLCCRSSRSPAW